MLRTLAHENRVLRLPLHPNSSAMEILHLDSKWSPPEELEAPDQPITNAHPGGVTVALSRAVGLFKWQLCSYVEVFKFSKMFSFVVNISIKSSKSQYPDPLAHIDRLPGQGSGPERIFLSPKHLRC